MFCATGSGANCARHPYGQFGNLATVSPARGVEGRITNAGETNRRTEKNSHYAGCRIVINVPSGISLLHLPEVKLGKSSFSDCAPIRAQ
jgi:hypothetical protein